MTENSIQLNQTAKKPSTWKMVKPHLFIVVLLAVVLLLFLFANFFAKDAIPLLIFSLLLMLPIIIIYKDNLPDFIPLALQNLLVDKEDELRKPSVKERQGFPTVTIKTKQIYITVAMSFLTIILILLLFQIKPDLDKNVNNYTVRKNKTFLKIMSAVFVAAFLGTLNLNLIELNETVVAT
jgi:hypothetical protein